MAAHFATLTPINQEALEAFDSLFTPMTTADRLSYHRQFVQFNPQETTIDEALKKCPAAPGRREESPLTSDTSFHSDTTQEDTAYANRQRLIHTGQYTFSFQDKLLVPQSGWRFGCGRHWENADRQDKRCDLLLARPSWQEAHPSYIHSDHASFAFNPSGVLGVRTRHTGQTTVGDVQLSDSEAFVGLLRNQTVIHFAGLEYMFTYCVPMEAESSHQAEKADYIADVLRREHPVVSISATPMPTDLWIGRWRVASAVGRGAESFFTGAHTNSGEMAVVKRLERTNATASRVTAEIAQYRRLYDVLHKDKDPRSRFIVRLHDVVYTSSHSDLANVPFHRDEAYLFLSPLARFTFAAGLHPSSTPHTTKLLLFHQVLQGLDLLHTRGIVHRDIKPENLCIVTLRSGREHAFIIDLGSAEWTKNAYPDIPCTPGRSGTLGFLAPEQEVAGSHYGRMVDVFALGCVGYWLFPGDGKYLLPRFPAPRNPWRTEWRDSPSAQAEQADFERKRDALATGSTSAQARVESLLREMLHVDPDRRITVVKALQHPVWQDLLLTSTTAGLGSKRLRHE